MPDISDCYHGRIEASLAEQRLRRFGKDRGYLDRVSNVQPGFFILSVFVKGEVIHRVFYSSLHRIHQGTFKCGSCSRFFKTKDELQEHKQKSHSREPGYACQHCSKKFNTSSARASKSGRSSVMWATLTRSSRPSATSSSARLWRAT